MKTKQRVSVNIHRNLDEALKKLAKEEGLSKSELVETAIKKAPGISLEKRIRRDYTLDAGLVEKIREQTGPDCFADFVNSALIKLLSSKKMI